MEISRGFSGSAPFARGWAVEMLWPGTPAIANTFGAAPTASINASRGAIGNTLEANVGGTVSIERLDGRVCAELGIGVVNEQVLIFPSSPRLAKPKANRYVNPDTMIHWWEYSARFRAPGASSLAIWHGLRVCTSAVTNQWSTDAPGAVGGVGIGISFDGAGALRARKKRLNAVGAMTDMGAPALPAGLVATDWLRWGHAIIAATPSRAARYRMYLENALLFELAFDDDGTGVTNVLPDYEAVSGAAPQFLASFQARSDQVAGVLLDVTDVHFRMGRYDPIMGFELPRT